MVVIHKNTVGNIRINEIVFKSLWKANICSTKMSKLIWINIVEQNRPNKKLVTVSYDLISNAWVLLPCNTFSASLSTSLLATRS